MTSIRSARPLEASSVKQLLCRPPNTDRPGARPAHRKETAWTHRDPVDATISATTTIRVQPEGAPHYTPTTTEETISRSPHPLLPRPLPTSSPTTPLHLTPRRAGSSILALAQALSGRRSSSPPCARWALQPCRTGRYAANCIVSETVMRNV